MGKFADEEEIYKRCLEQRTSKFGENHPSTLSTAVLLAQSQTAQGKYVEAEMLLKDCLAKQTTMRLSDAHTTRTILASTYYKMGNFIEAAALHKQSLDYSISHLGVDHPNTLCTMSCLANNYAAQDKFDEAEKLYWQCLTKETRVLGEHHPSTLNTSVV